MENKQEYEYDVAISFLNEDELLAVKIAQKISEYYNCFIYTEQQKRLVGQDGEVVFNKVFNNEARVVVILYREEWGENRWTRIEKTAIQNRALEKGYRFCLFVKLPNVKEIPSWIPNTYIYYNFEIFGFEALIAIILNKINEYGGIEKESSIIDVVKNLNQAKKIEKLKYEKLNRPDIIKIANETIDGLLDKVDEYYKNINQILEHSKLSKDESRTQTHEKYIKIKSYNLYILFYWKSSYTNSLNDSDLTIEIGSHKSRSLMPRPNEKQYSPGVIITKTFFISYDPDIHCYSLTDNKMQYSTQKLAEDYMRKYIEEYRKREV